MTIRFSTQVHPDNGSTIDQGRANMLNIQINVRSDAEARARLDAMSNVRVTDTVISDEPEEFAREMTPEILKQTDILFCSFPPTNHELMTNLTASFWR